MTDFTRLPDLANRALGGAVVAANDEFFAARRTSCWPEPAVAAHRVRAQGQGVRRLGDAAAAQPGHDWAIVRLGAPGIVAGIVVDTAHFTGNYPPRASLDGAAVEGHCSVDEMRRPTGSRCCR